MNYKSFECLKTSYGFDYQGHQFKTKSGRKCQNWWADEVSINANGGEIAKQRLNITLVHLAVPSTRMRCNVNMLRGSISRYS